jgi:tripeptide aminopeptidase
MSAVVERFFKYIAFDTRSDENSSTRPSTQGQKVLGEELAKELRELGLTDVSLDENGYVMATFPSNTDKQVPTVGFIAHMDTSPDLPGKCTNPKIIENYDGGDIVLNKKKNIILSPKQFPDLRDYIGETLITTDGTTLLGADDKAGIAEIISAMEYLMKNPQFKHGTIKVAFTPDEEIGRGADHFDVERFGADFAYTVDGGPIGEIEYENFNAAKAKIVVHGRNVHPGAAKNKMVNSMLIAMELNSLLPESEKPQYTENYEGFFHLTAINGDVEQTVVNYIIRDHDREKFDKKKRLMRDIVDFLNYKYGESIVELKMEDQYYNMKEKIEPVLHIVHTAQRAMKSLGIMPVILPVRGGTDGARLSYMNLPCPNIFTGGHNFHGRYEYIPVGSMEKAVNVILEIIKLYASGEQ